MTHVRIHTAYTRLVRFRFGLKLFFAMLNDVNSTVFPVVYRKISARGTVVKVYTRIRNMTHMTPASSYLPIFFFFFVFRHGADNTDRGTIYDLENN